MMRPARAIKPAMRPVRAMEMIMAMRPEVKLIIKPFDKI